MYHVWIPVRNTHTSRLRRFVCDVWWMQLLPRYKWPMAMAWVQGSWPLCSAAANEGALESVAWQEAWAAEGEEVSTINESSIWIVFLIPYWFSVRFCMPAPPASFRNQNWELRIQNPEFSVLISEFRAPSTWALRTVELRTQNSESSELRIQNSEFRTLKGEQRESRGEQSENQ